SPSTSTRPVVAVTSQATWASGSCAMMSSRMASAIWSQTLSGCPSVTDSEVISSEGLDMKVMVIGVWSSLGNLVPFGACFSYECSNSIACGGGADGLESELVRLPARLDNAWGR